MQALRRFEGRRGGKEMLVAKEKGTVKDDPF
jgi:hypothetical protein